MGFGKSYMYNNTIALITAVVLWLKNKQKTKWSLRVELLEPKQVQCIGIIIFYFTIFLYKYIT